MSTSIAYALRAEYDGTVEQIIDGEATEVPVFSGGVINLGDRELDLRALLDEDPHPGTIIVAETDTAAIVALDNSPAFKRVATPIEPDATDQAEQITVGPYDGVSFGDLRTEAKELGLHVERGVKRDQLAAALGEFKTRIAEGDTAIQPSETNEVHVTTDGLTNITQEASS